jgi:hypothetical protein
MTQEGRVCRVCRRLAVIADRQADQQPGGLAGRYRARERVGVLLEQHVRHFVRLVADRQYVHHRDRASVAVQGEVESVRSAAQPGI